MKFLSDILAKAGLTVDGVVTLNNTATGQTPDANDNSTKLATTAWVRTFVQPYSLPIASASTLGGIKVGAGLSINPSTGVLSASAAGISTRDIYTFTATAGQTTFSCSYTVDQVDVFYNGSKLGASEFTATNGTSVVLNTACKVGDYLEIVSWVAGAGLSSSRTLTIDGVTYDLTANRTWNILPTGGAAGDILAKSSATNYDVAWIPNYTSTVQHTVKAAVAVTKGQAVYVSSADGTNMIVSKASNASEQTSSKTLGLVAQDLAINGQGFVVTEGLLAGLNTSTANAGDPVWLGTDGNLIFGLLNKPTAPVHLVFIGIVTRVQTNNGEIFVKVQNGFEMSELHDYVQSGVQDNFVISYESSTSLYKPKSIATLLGYTPANAARSLTINGTSYDLTADRTWTLTTSNITEGTNLYYTDTRVGTYLTANSYATQSYVSTQINNLVSGAPGLLDTLDELAAALGDDPNFATTVSTALSNRLRIDIGTQGLTSTQQGYGRTNLGLGSLAVLSSVANAQITDLAYSKLTGVPSTFAPSAHTHVWTDITDRPTNLSAFTNGPGYLTGITSSQVTTALGYTPYNATNPSGYITGITSSNVTTALGYTPYNSTNPSGYISSYTETDTLATVTGRGASTSSSITTGGLIISAVGVDVRVNRGRFQVWNNAATGNLGYRIRTDEEGGWRWQFVDGGNTEYFGVTYSTGVLTLRPSSGTIIERGGFSDFIGYNASYGSYIGGGVSNASNYLYAGGYFYDGAAIRTLIHSGNIGSQSVSYATTAGSLTSMNISQFTNNSGYVTTSGLSTDADSEQTIGGRAYYFNSGAGRMNADPRWNESGYDADLGCLHLWSWTAAGVAYGRAGIAFFNGSAYQYLTTKASTTGLFVNNTQVVTNSGTWGISISGNAATSTIFNNGSLYVSIANGNTLNSGFNNPGDGNDIWINYRGYNDTFSHFRDFRVGDGKGAQVALFTGSNKSLVVAGTITASNISGTNTGDQTNISGNAATASAVGWAGVTAGTRTGHGDIRFQPPASSFAGIQFLDTSGNGAGWFLIRGTSDTDVYTAEGITLVADKGWLTLAQRETAGRGVRIMTGTTSTTRIAVTDATTTINNTLTAGGTINIDGSLRFQSADDRRLYGASVGSGYNCVRVQGNWNTFDIMGRVIDWTGSNLHFGNGYNGEDHSSYYAVLGNPVSYFKVEGPIYATGDIIAYYSDRRLKQNIQPIDSALDILNKIGTYTFEWNKKSEDVWAKKEGDQDFGLISQEVEAAWPLGVAIQGGKDINDKYDYGNPESKYYDPLHVEKNPEEYKTVRYDKMVTIAIAAIKELKAENDALKEILKRNNII